MVKARKCVQCVHPMKRLGIEGSSGAKFGHQLLRTCCLCRQSKGSKLFPEPCRGEDWSEGFWNLRHWPLWVMGQERSRANRHPSVVLGMGRLGGWEGSPSSCRGLFSRAGWTSHFHESECVVHTADQRRQGR